MTFAGEEAGGRIKADPTGAREIDFAPRVEVGEILFGAGRTIEGLLVGLELDEVTGDETKIEAIERLLRQFGIKEMVRTGKIALVRGPNKV